MQQGLASKWPISTVPTGMASHGRRRGPSRGVRMFCVVGLVAVLLTGFMGGAPRAADGSPVRVASLISPAGAPAGLDCQTQNSVGSLSVLAPASAAGIVGTHVTLEGSGFFNIDSIFIFFAPPPGSTYTYLEVGSVAPDTTEPFETTVTVPGGSSLRTSAGLAEFWALDAESNCASAGFTISGIPPPAAECVSYEDSLSIEVPSPATGPAGTQVTLTGAGFYPMGSAGLWWSAPNGTSPYYQEVGYAPGETFTTQVTVPSGYAAGTYLFWASDAIGDCAAAEFNLTGAALAGGVASASPVTIDFGQQTSTISPTGVSGGSPPYAYTWYDDSVDTGTCGSSPTETVLGIGPTWTTSSEILGPGTYYYCYVVSDSASNSQPSGYATLTVNPTLTPPTISVAPATIAQGQSIILSTVAAFEGGTSPYTCQWEDEYPGGSGWTTFSAPFACLPGTSPETGYTATGTPGNYSFELNVTDDAGVMVASHAVTVAVTAALPTPGLALSLDPSTISLWESTNVSVTVSGSGPIPTGSVTVSDGLSGTNDTCTIPALNSSGAGSCELEPSDVGVLTVTVTYSGDSNYASVVRTVLLTVTALDFTTTPDVGSQDETLDVVLGGFTPSASGMTVTFGNSNSGVAVDSFTITGPSNITVQITIGLDAPIQADAVTVTIVTVLTPPHVDIVHTLNFPAFHVTSLDLTMTPSSGTQDETLDMVLGGFTPPSPSLLLPQNVSFSGPKCASQAKGHPCNDGVVADSVTISGLSSITVQITIARSAKIHAYAVSLRWCTGTTRQTCLSLGFGDFHVLGIAVTMSPKSGSQDETLYIAVGGFTMAPSASDMNVSFSPKSGIAVDSVTLTGLSSMLVEVTIADHAKTGGEIMTVEESVSGGLGTVTTIRVSGFKVTSFDLTMSPKVGAQGSTLDVSLSGFTVAPIASDMTVTFGSASSEIQTDLVTLTGPSSIIVEITIALSAPLVADVVTIVESVAGQPHTFTALEGPDFTVTA